MKKSKLLATIGGGSLATILCFQIMNNKVLAKQSKDYFFERTSTTINQFKSSIDLIEMPLPLMNSEERVEEITHIVLHFISNVIIKPENPYDIEDIYSILEENEVSAHYAVDREGKIYLFVSEDRVAYHAGKGSIEEYPEYDNKLNQYSIGIEILGIGTEEEMSIIMSDNQYDEIDTSFIGYTDAQYEAVNTLINDILLRNENIENDRVHIIGHDEYNPDKTDPGVLFNWENIGFYNRS